MDFSGIGPRKKNTDESKFYTRVHANVVVEIVKNFLTPNGWDDLMLQQHKFAFTYITGMKSYDGPTMLKVLLDKIDQKALVNMELHRQAIEGAKLQEHKGNVIEMCKSIERRFQAILKNGMRMMLRHTGAIFWMHSCLAPIPISILE